MTRRLDDIVVPAEPRAVLLFLHGGQQRSTDPVENKHASWWRVAMMARSLRGFARERGLAVVLLQYAVRGWNDELAPSPVTDARWALDERAERIPGRPVVLVGHSMGGRTACRVADDPNVLGVVGLAPWLPEREPVGAIAGRALHVIHGTRDRWTSATLSRQFVERAQPLATEATWTSLPGVGHFMFRRVRTWNRFVEDSVERIWAQETEGKQ